MVVVCTWMRKEHSRGTTAESGSSTIEELGAWAEVCCCFPREGLFCLVVSSFYMGFLVHAFSVCICYMYVVGRPAAVDYNHSISGVWYGTACVRF